MNTGSSDRAILTRIARRAMAERGLLTDFSADAEREVASASAARDGGGDVVDLRHLPWCSIDNDDSRDLDQLTAASVLPEGGGRLLVAVADVDAVVPRDGAVDAHARHNTTSVYTPAVIFPMLPERLSTDLTSLNPGADRLAIVVSLDIHGDGSLKATGISRAIVRNQAQLAYDNVAAWLDDVGPVPAAVADVPALEPTVRLQHQLAQALRARRLEEGAISLDTREAQVTLAGDAVGEIRAASHNHAKELIEEAMVAVNGVTARLLGDRGLASIRRVVRTPRRWERIVELAATFGATLPELPDPRALAGFLAKRRAADALRFPDLSLAVVKLLGPGEYVAAAPGAETIGHFGLAVRDYAHSTAPNRRFPDLVTHRLVKAALAKRPAPYQQQELEEIARDCTRREDDASKVERQVRKSAAALLLAGRIGARFEGIVTGAAAKGTWVRVVLPPVEGRVIRGERGLDVGDRVEVSLVATDVERGFIDFARAGSPERP